MPPSKPQDPTSVSPGASSSPGGAVKPTTPLAPLRLVALDAGDLTILASHLQDAVVRVRDMAYVPKNRRFALILNRFNWLTADTGGDGRAREKGRYERRRCGVRFEHVRAVRTTGFSQRDKKQVLSLLTVAFEQAREGEPDGSITLLFAGGAAIRLEVECVEAELRDLGAGWRATGKPDHPQY